MSYLPSLPHDATLLAVLRAYPASAGPLLDYHEVLLRGPSPLTVAERELIAAYASGLNRGWLRGRGHRLRRGQPQPRARKAQVDEPQPVTPNSGDSRWSVWFRSATGSVRSRCSTPTVSRWNWPACWTGRWWLRWSVTTAACRAEAFLHQLEDVRADLEAAGLRVIAVGGAADYLTNNLWVPRLCAASSIVVPG